MHIERTLVDHMASAPQETLIRSLRKAKTESLRRFGVNPFKNPMSLIYSICRSYRTFNNPMNLLGTLFSESKKKKDSMGNTITFLF